jgi:hypothetical protein
MTLRSWMRTLVGREGAKPRARSRHPGRSPGSRARLSLEALEERAVPSTLTVTRGGDDVSDKHTLRYAVAHAQDGDTILLAADLENTPIVLSHGELVLGHDVTVKGVGNAPETICRRPRRCRWRRRCWGG